MPNSNSAKFTFLYLLSLISLAFFAISVGIVLFQVINKNITDMVETYSMRYSIQALRFAISAMIVSAPIYFVSVWQINKNLISGALSKESGIRKWLTYFILLVTFFIMVGEAIAVINNFLNGELTLKFILKALTVLAISGAIFAYYLYDIKRDKVEGAKDKAVKNFFYASAVITIIVFIAGIFFVESPFEARKKRYDREVLERLSSVGSGIQTYYYNEEKLPADFSVLLEDATYLVEKDVTNPVTEKQFEYKIISERKYELCTDFQTSNKDEDDMRYEHLDDRWPHEAGEQCISRTVQEERSEGIEKLRPVPMD